MHILFFLNSLTTGGAERVTVHLANHWASVGHQITIVTLKPVAEDQFDLHPGIARVSLNLNRPSGGVWGGAMNNLRRIRATLVL